MRCWLLLLLLTSCTNELTDIFSVSFGPKVEPVSCQLDSGQVYTQCNGAVEPGEIVVWYDEPPAKDHGWSQCQNQKDYHEEWYRYGCPTGGDCAVSIDGGALLYGKCQ